MIASARAIYIHDDTLALFTAGRRIRMPLDFH